jgi:phage FluMu protein gp41
VTKVNAPYLLETPCEFWAQAANFISSKSIENHIKVGMNQLVALAYFTTCQSASLSSLEFTDDSTVRFLYSICKTNMKKKGDSKIIQIIDQSTEQIKKAIELDEENLILTAEKCKSFAEQLLETIQAQKRKLVEVYELDTEVSQRQQKKYTTEDFKFIETNSEPNKTRNWKKIFNEGKAKGFFTSYTSSNSLKSSYHHAKKREKN